MAKPGPLAPRLCDQAHIFHRHTHAHLFLCTSGSRGSPSLGHPVSLQFWKAAPTLALAAALTPGPAHERFSSNVHGFKSTPATNILQPQEVPQPREDRDPGQPEGALTAQPEGAEGANASTGRGWRWGSSDVSVTGAHRSLPHTCHPWWSW